LARRLGAVESRNLTIASNGTKGGSSARSAESVGRSSSSTAELVSPPVLSAPVSPASVMKDVSTVSAIRSSSLSIQLARSAPYVSPTPSHRCRLRVFIAVAVRSLLSLLFMVNAPEVGSFQYK